MRRYPNPATGAFHQLLPLTPQATFTSQSESRLGPITNLYVVTQNAANVMRFNYPTGAFMDFFIPDGGGGLTAPFHLTFSADPHSKLTYTVHRDCLNNVDDAGGRWQIEGGKVLENGKHVADYSEP